MKELEDWEQAAELLHDMSFEDYKRMAEHIQTKYTGKQTLTQLQLALDYYFYENELREKGRKNDKN